MIPSYFCLQALPITEVLCPVPFRTTISLAVIVFELTRTMNYVVPVMISVLVAKTVADFIQPTGLYDCVIE